jgi:hypothetical protein
MLWYKRIDFILLMMINYQLIVVLQMRQELSQPPHLPPSLHSQALGSSGANSTSPTPSPTSVSEDSPSHQGD